MLRPARSRRWPDPSAEVLAGGGAALGLVLIGVGLAVHLAAGPTALQLVLAVAALAVRPLAVLTHRRSSSQPASTTHHEPTGVP